MGRPPKIIIFQIHKRFGQGITALALINISIGIYVFSSLGYQIPKSIIIAVIIWTIALAASVRYHLTKSQSQTRTYERIPLKIKTLQRKYTLEDIERSAPVSANPEETHSSEDEQALRGAQHRRKRSIIIISP